MITTLDEVTPAWLTRTLQRSGALPQGRVTALRARPEEAHDETIAHLDVEYSADASGALPPCLLLKLKHAGQGAREVGFYKLAAGIPHARLPVLAQCYAALCDARTGDSYCLLEDLSATHAPPIPRARFLAGDSMPSQPKLAQMVDTLALFHAYWWEHPQLAQVPGVTDVYEPFRDAAAHAREMQRCRADLDAFAAREGRWFPADLRRLLENVLAQLPRIRERELAARVEARRHLTLANGACTIPQFLCLKGITATLAMLVDFDAVGANFGAYDLVYLFARSWGSLQRREQHREETLMRRYHDGLLRHGVSDYAMDRLWQDYRVMITYMLFDPVRDAVHGEPKGRWWGKLDCLVQAFRDLDCVRLLVA